MPYAYIHYPFENVELFENNFPGHFVAEGLDQTRGWLVSCLSCWCILIRFKSIRLIIFRYDDVTSFLVIVKN